jgi:hypothetical protein
VVDTVTRVVQTGDSVDVKDPHAIRLLHEPGSRPLWYNVQGASAAQAETNPAVPISPLLPPGDEPPSITIKNNTGMSIVYIFFKPASSSIWGHDRLGQLEMFDNRASISLLLDEPLSAGNRYDLRLRDVDGTEYIKWNVLVAEDSVFVFNPADIANWAE